jgi:uncharacterized protein (DUF983 family)
MTSVSRVSALARGLKHRCPHCGKGRLYRAYLKVADACTACGHELGQYRADDGPAYFTILLVGHLVVAPMLFFPIVWKAPLLIVLPLVVVSLALVSLALLPRVKGVLVGLLYSLGTSGEHAPGSELEAAEAAPADPVGSHSGAA